MNLNSEITELLNNEGCGIVGFADLRSLSGESRQNFDRGIVIALTLTKESMIENMRGSLRRYYDESQAINERLPDLAGMVAEMIVGKGYKALVRMPTSIAQDTDRRTILPHKTVATLSGIGWIGKCALLVTEKAGSALRLITVLTDAPLECGTPITRSKCDRACMICADICPGKAVTGRVLWEVGVDRERLFIAENCFTAARSRARKELNVEGTFCGMCMSNCPFTKHGLGYE